MSRVLEFDPNMTSEKKGRKNPPPVRVNKMSLDVSGIFLYKFKEFSSSLVYVSTRNLPKPTLNSPEHPWNTPPKFLEQVAE